MDKKPILDKDGNPITRETLKKVFGEKLGEAIKPLLEKCEWEEDGKIYHTWRINAGASEGKRSITGYTNDAGAAQIQKAMEDYVKKEYGTMEDRTDR